MCTRITYNDIDGDTVNGFDFDIDLSVWDHKVICGGDRFYIGIKRPDGLYHSYHGINKNGNVGTLLYVHGNAAAAYTGEGIAISDLTEKFIKAEMTLDEAKELARAGCVTYASDSTMQAMLSDKTGRVLIIEPGIGYRTEYKRYSLITNYSVIEPESTLPYIVPGDDRYERANELLEKHTGRFSLRDALDCLYEVRQEGIWASRVSFVYSEKEHRGLYVQNNHFDGATEFCF